MAEITSKMRKSQNLIIISIPFSRIIKNTLSDITLGTFIENSDILIYSPFSKNKNFIKDLNRDGVNFINFTTPKFSFVEESIFLISDLCRRHGFIRKNKALGLAYYHHNRNTKFLPEGQTGKYNLFTKIGLFVTSFLGQLSWVWRLIEGVIPLSRHHDSELIGIADDYENVTLIQSANWGVQDRLLSSLSRRKGWRAILIPYTTDQILLNGYFINHFAKVCVQGEFEYNFCRDVHKLPTERICKLGSSWFRHVDSIIQNSTKRTRKEKVILYAGASNTYFPSESELLGVDTLVKLCAHLKGSYRVVYRPVVFDASHKRRIVKKYKGSACVEIIWPDDALIGETLNGSGQRNAVLFDYVESLINYEIVVMSGFTSLALDAAYIGKCGIISNMIDTNKVLKRRHQHLFPTWLLPGVVISKSVACLEKNIITLLKDKALGARNSKKMVSVWDYPEVNYGETLGDILLAEERSNV